MPLKVPAKAFSPASVAPIVLLGHPPLRTRDRTPTPATSNSPTKKRRKKNKKSKNNKGQQNAQKKPKRKHNWIESCSDSIHRIPAGSAAPLTCIVTRVEIDEEPLLPKGVSDGSAKGCDGDGNNGERDAEESNVEDNATTPSEETDAIASNEVPWETATTVEVGKDLAEAGEVVHPREAPFVCGRPNEVGARKKEEWQASQQELRPPPRRGQRRRHHESVPLPHWCPDKFWAQRKRLFSRYDEGIQIGGKDDPEMWYSVTPEGIANHVAGRMVQMIRKSQLTDGADKRPDIVILDPFCGCGGNSIAFARLNNTTKEDGGEASPRVKVIAVDNSLSRLKMAAHNASIYGIDPKDIVFVHADAVEMLSCYSKGVLESKDCEEEQSAKDETCSGYALGGVELLPGTVDGVFLSPPWGGMDYGKAGFDPVSSISIESKLTQEAGNEDDKVTSVTTNGGELLSLAAHAIQLKGAIAYFLPRNTYGISVGQIAVAAGLNGCFEMEQNVVVGKVKTVTAYFGQGVKALLSE
ncbi:hypothetical protein ACHAXT_002432 [Thalassiosira profunda]